MKTPNKWVSLLLVVCFVAVFTGCQGRAGFGESASNPSLAQTAAQEPLGVSDMKLLTKWNGVCSGAGGE